jgi:predicted TIM-barrel fold metal-dependent hydrolase
MPEVNKALEHVFFDTAASPFLYNPQVYPQVAGLAGAEKILFGTDYPLLSPRRLLKEIEGLELPQYSKEQILGKNAAELGPSYFVSPKTNPEAHPAEVITSPSTLTSSISPAK